MRNKELREVPSAKRVIARILIAQTIKFALIAMISRAMLHAAERRAAAA